MTKVRTATAEQKLQDKIDSLVAIGAAMAANCIPCFEHLYEKAIHAGITPEEIKRASDIAGQVKTGANIALTNSVNEILGTNDTCDPGCSSVGQQPCRC